MTIETGSRRASLLAVLVLGSLGCAGDTLPSNVTDPAITQTPEGALAAYRGTVALLRWAMGHTEGAGDGGIGGRSGPSAVATSGLISDELRLGARFGANERPLYREDQRSLPEIGEQTSNGTFQNLQKLRGQAGQAVGLLTRYGSAEQQPLAGHVYALQGYAEVLLAELYCSGVPLSTVDFNGDYTFRPGSTTAQVFAHAVALFDTALTLAGDSTRFVSLAAVGKARALLGLGDYTAAAAAAAAVPDDFRYEISYSAADGAGAKNFGYSVSANLWPFSVADREGGNGLNYATSGDPRVAVTLDGTNAFGYAVYLPSLYAADGSSPIVLASGVEARLIEAEAALQAGDTDGWLGTLNDLRRNAWPGIRPATPGALPDTTDPGAFDARVDLLFHERAFWLFLTGHRQGDLRRLIRQYGRPQSGVYPVGIYPGLVGGSYGFDVALPIPSDERVLNPLFTGCLSRGV